MTRRTLHKERRKKQKREELMIITASATIICSLLVGISQMPVQANVSTAEQIKPVFDTYYQKQDKLAYTLTQEEKELIERVVASEGRGEGRTGQALVCQVILNRAELWDMSILDVLTAPNQFSKPYQGEISEDIKDMVSLVFDEGYRPIDANITHFHANYVNPVWASSKTFVLEHGNHLFYE